eukprot:gene29343-8897_t
MEIDNSSASELLVDGLRKDGRGHEEFRSVFVDTKVISQAKGSAYAEFNNTKVMVGVYGPRQSERKVGFSELGRVQVDVRLTTFAAGKLGKQAQMSFERSMAAAMQQALSASVLLDRIPKACVDVMVMVLESGGSDLAVATTAASVALADAGIEIKDLVPTCQVARLNGAFVLDPSLEEEMHQEGSMLLALMPASNEITQMLVT